MTVTQAWSLRVELVFYGLMIVLCRNLKITIFWFFLSIILTIYLLNQELIFSKYYNTVLGASLAFSGGSLIYFLKPKIHLKSIHIPISLTLWFLHLLLAESIWNFPEVPSAIHAIFHKHHFGLYANVILAIYVMYAIACTKLRSDGEGILGRIDKFLGDMAYGVFLIHMIGIAVAKKFITQNYWADHPFIVVLFALGVTTSITIILFYGLEKPINRHFRDRIRPKKIQEP